MTLAPAARTVRLWIADSGALDEPVGPAPLVIDETLRADFVACRAPWGQDLRGDAVMVALYQRHVLVTGLSNQGKTAALRALAPWAALDPCTEFRIADLKGAGDWSPFESLATVLIEGPTDEHVIAAAEMLEAGVGGDGAPQHRAEGLRLPGLRHGRDGAQARIRLPPADPHRERGTGRVHVPGDRPGQAALRRVEGHEPIFGSGSVSVTGQP